MRPRLPEIATRRPRTVVAVTVVLTVALLTQFPRIQIDTDPENMLRADEPVRLLHDEIKEDFNLHDFLVLGIVREQGVFQPETLERVAVITERILEIDGVIGEDVLAPTEVDDISVEDGAVLRVGPLMDVAPQNVVDAKHIHERILANAMLRGKLASDDGKAIALYLPLKSKDISAEVAQQVSAIVADVGGDEHYHLAGLPVAEDTFGSAMFGQMALAAPAAMVLLFLLMLYFFRDARAVATSMAVAMITVIWVMGALIGLGFTVHIMSSMIPIFLLPVAILDAIHVLSEMYDRRAAHGDTRRAIADAMHHLYKPMLFTSVTTAVGFGSLLFTPIPPVQVFGAFVALGVLVAWFLTMTFLPALLVLQHQDGEVLVVTQDAQESTMERQLQNLRRWSLRARWSVVAASLLILAGSLWGISQIQVNDNPIRWFRPGHPLRVADEELKAHLSGTYMAYLRLSSAEEGRIYDPDAMKYIEELQRQLLSHSNVGATTSVADIVKKVGYELALEDDSALVVPDDRQTIAQFLFLYEMSGGDPEDLYHFITPEASAANIWVQMRAGENREVSSVLAMVDEYLDGKPLPQGLALDWGGLSYVNVVWQERMVTGMGKALAGSGIVVLVLMTILFRSFLWGLVSMLPLAGTIVFVYGLLGLVGKDYDMPVAVLSSLTLGLSIDFAIHFIQRSRELYSETGSYEEAMKMTFSGTGRAIFRNVMVLAIGFVPMFFSNLTPYVTVGMFFFLIMMASGLVTLVLLPAVTGLRPTWFYRPQGSQPSPRAMAATVVAVTVGALSMSSVPQARAQDAPDAVTLMKQSHLAAFYTAEDGRAEVHMTLRDKKGRERLRHFTMIRLDIEDGGDQRYYTFFHKPADVRRMTFMVAKHNDKDDDRWIYVPAVDLVRRISAKDKNSSFVGSDFSYEDVSGRHWNDDTHELLGKADLDGKPVWQVKSVPTDGAKWSYRVSSIDQESKLPLREEYFDAKGNMIRLFTADKIEIVDGFPTIAQRTMKDLKRQHETTVEFRDVQYNIGVEVDIFTERYLKNPPRNYVQ